MNECSASIKFPFLCEKDFPVSKGASSLRNGTLGAKPHGNWDSSEFWEGVGIGHTKIVIQWQVPKRHFFRIKGAVFLFSGACKFKNWYIVNAYSNYLLTSKALLSS